MEAEQHRRQHQARWLRSIVAAWAALTRRQKLLAHLLHATLKRRMSRLAAATFWAWRRSACLPVCLPVM